VLAGEKVNKSGRHSVYFGNPPVPELTRLRDKLVFVD
jgi:hypothetical protein